MPDFASLEAFGRHVAKFSGEFDGPQLKQIVTDVGVEAKKIAARHVDADLGGTGFSGWAAPLDTRFDHVAPGKVSFHPTRRSAGPWTVAEYGRNQTAGPRLTGPRLTRTGKVSKAKGRRWNGRTSPHNTATETTADIDRTTPKLVERAVVRAVRRYWD
jgi:hypothetical protein